MPNIDTLLTTIRDDSSFKTRIFAFAALPLDMQRVVLSAGKTIADGAKVTLDFLSPDRLIPAA